LNRAQKYIDYLYAKFVGRVPFKAGSPGGFSFVYPFVFENGSGNAIGLVSVAWEKESSDNLVRLFHLSAFKMGFGDGSQILTVLCSLADEFGVDLTLQAEPQSNGLDIISQDKLLSWYRKFGFEGSCIMMRRAKR